MTRTFRKKFGFFSKKNNKIINVTNYKNTSKVSINYETTIEENMHGDLVLEPSIVTKSSVSSNPIFEYLPVDSTFFESNY